MLILGLDNAEGVPNHILELSKHPFGCRNYAGQYQFQMFVAKDQKLHEQRLTIHTSIIGFHICFFNLPVLDNKRVSLAPVTTKYGGAVEGKAKSAGKFCGGITEETDLLGRLGTESGGLKQGRCPKGTKIYG